MHHLQKVVYEYDVAIEEWNGNMSRKRDIFLTLGATADRKIMMLLLNYIQ